MIEPECEIWSKRMRVEEVWYYTWIAFLNVTYFCKDSELTELQAS